MRYALALVPALLVGAMFWGRAAVASAATDPQSANASVADLGRDFGPATLVDEIDVGAIDPGHLFTQSPEGSSQVRTILGRRARVLAPGKGEGSYLSFRMGQSAKLKPGGHYVLEVVYPEDQPRTFIVLNSGNDSTLGFHTGATVGDAFHPKYVDNLNESIGVPLSGKYESWRMYFNLHDRFSDRHYVRGGIGNRDLTPDDGFTVTIAQFSADNMPVSRGLAVATIRLYELADAPPKARYAPPPEGLPRRHLFWREEMSDGVIHGEKNGTPAGLRDPLDWYRFKANQMDFLGMNTYAKDLLEFGANQHWDSTPYGGHAWVYYDAAVKDLWGRIVHLMGERGFAILPYYEYSGSKGQDGLGPKRRAIPLSRDDAYTHIKWIESANADLTDPDTYADFKKMLDLTIVRYKDQAKFAGAWIRPRAQLPIGFGDATRKRFADEANGGRAITRQQLRNDPALYGRYKQWWMGKRRQFLAAMRDHLREHGIDDAVMLYTSIFGEPGVSFKGRPTSIVTDDVDGWTRRLAGSENPKDRKVTPIGESQVVSDGLYRKALVAPWDTWGNWEVQHANPESDPRNYKDIDGALMTYAFNRRYTVLSPEALEDFRGPAGLAIVRHYTLNENMMYDKDDKEKLGYFTADIERAGPYVMMGEALAMANGDPRYIGYLRGRNFARGFPRYVREFNTAFLSLPALPSKVLSAAASDRAVVVRSIPTTDHGVYFAVVNTAMDDCAVELSLPGSGAITDAATGETVTAATDGKVRLELYPYQMRALRRQ